MYCAWSLNPQIFCLLTADTRWHCRHTVTVKSPLLPSFTLSHHKFYLTHFLRAKEDRKYVIVTFFFHRKEIRISNDVCARRTVLKLLFPFPILMTCCITRVAASIHFPGSSEVRVFLCACDGVQNVVGRKSLKSFGRNRPPLHNCAFSCHVNNPRRVWD